MQDPTSIATPADSACSVHEVSGSALDLSGLLQHTNIFRSKMHYFAGVPCVGKTQTHQSTTENTLCRLGRTINKVIRAILVLNAPTSARSHTLDYEAQEYSSGSI